MKSRKKAKKSLVKLSINKNDVLNAALESLDKSIKKKRVERVAQKIKEIRMAELTLKKLKKQLKEMLNRDITEEEYLFGEDAVDNEDDED